MKLIIILPVCLLILETCLRKAFMFLRADMSGTFSELATADKEQTVANPIIIKVNSTVLIQFHSLCETCKSLQPAKPVKDNLAILSGNLKWWFHQQWNSAINSHKRNAPRNISPKISNDHSFTQPHVITIYQPYGVLFLCWTQKNYY